MDLINYLTKEYGYREPILLEDLTDELSNISASSLRQKLKRLVDREVIYRFENGIYFIPNPNSLLKTKTLSVEKVLEKKHIIKNNNRIGYVSGLAFANSLQLTTQVPSKIEIVTMKEARTKRTVTYKNNSIILRKPRLAINNDNYKILQVLDLVNKYEEYIETPAKNTNEKILAYLEGNNITKKELYNYLKNYPTKTYKNILESGLYDEITQR
ncbi:DUF6088 family protein [Virgibacillus natechei]|uniref:DUF6088 family protein n=1 Tax=Virgibacillus sp. CBA3643 TaxID=2942278 RepID=UPI0035A363C5